MIKWIAALLFWVPFAAQAGGDDIYLCLDNGKLTRSAQNEWSEDCPEKVEKSDARYKEWLAVHDAPPTQALIDRSYNKLYCNQPGIREMIAVAAQDAGRTPAQHCALMRGKR